MIASQPLLSTIALVLLAASGAPQGDGQVAYMAVPRDLKTAVLPADDLATALELVECRIPARQACDRLIERMTELPFAWHSIGYRFVLEAAATDDKGAILARDLYGLARRGKHEIVLYNPAYPSLLDATDPTRFGQNAFINLGRTVAHEVGHAIHQSCGDTQLGAWAQWRDLPDGIPTHGHHHELFDSVAEDFAEAAVVWLLDGRYPSRSPYDTSEVTPDHLHDVSTLFRARCQPTGIQLRTCWGTPPTRSSRSSRSPRPTRPDLVEQPAIRQPARRAGGPRGLMLRRLRARARYANASRCQGGRT